MRVSVPVDCAQWPLLATPPETNLEAQGPFNGSCAALAVCVPVRPAMTIMLPASYCTRGRSVNVMVLEAPRAAVLSEIVRVAHSTSLLGMVAVVVAVDVPKTAPCMAADGMMVVPKAATVGESGGPFLFGDAPTSYDAALFGCLNGIVYAPFEHPVHQKARALPGIVRFCDAVRARYFPQGGKYLDHGRAAAAAAQGPR